MKPKHAIFSRKSKIYHSLAYAGMQFSGYEAGEVVNLTLLK